jgi:hypothetical protein
MGNFSRDPKIALQNALDRGYSRLLFQQGKPVLDRELNLLAGLTSLQRLALYLGDGVPVGSNGFAVSNLNVPANDFVIVAGRCLVAGQEVLLAANATYRTQPNPQNVAPLPAGKSNVYLRVFSVEVNAAQDADLGNAGDVGMETSVREKTDWEVKVSVAPINAPDHFLLASIDTTTNAVVDGRRRALTLAALRDELERARGSTAELDVRLDASLLADGNLRTNAVAEPNMADSAVATRAVANGAVSIQKLRSTLVFDGQVSVPASPGPGQVGEVTVTLLSADTSAFLLVSVHYDGPRPVFPIQQPHVFSIDWKHRVTAVKPPGPSPYTHFHQIVISNGSSEALSATCRAYSLGET